MIERFGRSRLPGTGAALDRVDGRDEPGHDGRRIGENLSPFRHRERSDAIQPRRD
jgi:hypothetical protein